MTIYHKIFELLNPPTPAGARTVHKVLEARAQVLYPEGYQAPDFLPEVSMDLVIFPKLEVEFDKFIDQDGLEITCIEARRALSELFEKIGGQL